MNTVSGENAWEILTGNTK